MDDTQDSQNKKKMVLKKKKKIKLPSNLNSSRLSRNNTLNSTLLKMTLKTNNRNLARALERVRQDLADSQKQVLQELHEKQVLQGKYCTLKKVAGLQNDEIEGEVQDRMSGRLLSIKDGLNKISASMLGTGRLLSIKDGLNKISASMLGTVELIHSALGLCELGASRGSSFGQMLARCRMSDESTGDVSPSPAASLPSRSIYYTGPSSSSQSGGAMRVDPSALAEPEQVGLSGEDFLPLAGMSDLSMIVEQSGLGEGLLFTDDDHHMDRRSKRGLSLSTRPQSGSTGRRTSRRSSNLVTGAGRASGVQAEPTQSNTDIWPTSQETSAEKEKLSSPSPVVPPDERPIVSKFAPHISRTTPPENSKNTTPVNLDEAEFISRFIPIEEECTQQKKTTPTNRNAGTGAKKAGKLQKKQLLKDQSEDEGKQDELESLATAENLQEQGTSTEVTEELLTAAAAVTSSEEDSTDQQPEPEPSSIKLTKKNVRAALNEKDQEVVPEEENHSDEGDSEFESLQTDARKRKSVRKSIKKRVPLISSDGTESENENKNKKSDKNKEVRKSKTKETSASTKASRASDDDSDVEKTKKKQHTRGKTVTGDENVGRNRRETYGKSGAENKVGRGEGAGDEGKKFPSKLPRKHVRSKTNSGDSSKNRRCVLSLKANGPENSSQNDKSKEAMADNSGGKTGSKLRGNESGDTAKADRDRRGTFVVSPDRSSEAISGDKRGTFVLPKPPLPVEQKKKHDSGDKRGTFVLPKPPLPAEEGKGHDRTDKRGTFVLPKPPLPVEQKKAQNSADKRGTFVLPRPPLPMEQNKGKQAEGGGINGRRGTFVLPKPQQGKSQEDDQINDSNVGDSEQDLFEIGDSILIDSETMSPEGKGSNPAFGLSDDGVFKIPAPVVPQIIVQPTEVDVTVCEPQDMSFTGIFDGSDFIQPGGSSEKMAVPSFITRESSEPAFLINAASPNIVPATPRVVAETDSEGETEENVFLKDRKTNKTKNTNIAAQPKMQIADDILDDDNDETIIEEKIKSDSDSSEGERIKKNFRSCLPKPGKISFKAGRKDPKEVFNSSIIKSKAASSVVSRYKKVKSTAIQKGKISKKSKATKVIPSTSPLNESRKGLSKSVWDLSLNESIPVPSSLSYGQFMDHRKAHGGVAGAAGGQEQPVRADPNNTNPLNYTETEHGIMRVLGNGKRTKPRKPKEKIGVTYSENLEEDHLITPPSSKPEKQPAKSAQKVKADAGHTPPRKPLDKGTKKRLQQAIVQHNLASDVDSEAHDDDDDDDVILSSQQQDANQPEISKPAKPDGNQPEANSKPAKLDGKNRRSSVKKRKLITVNPFSDIESEDPGSPATTKKPRQSLIVPHKSRASDGGKTHSTLPSPQSDEGRLPRRLSTDSPAITGLKALKIRLEKLESTNTSIHLHSETDDRASVDVENEEQETVQLPTSEDDQVFSQNHDEETRKSGGKTKRSKSRKSVQANRILSNVLDGGEDSEDVFQKDPPQVKRKKSSIIKKTPTSAKKQRSLSTEKKRKQGDSDSEEETLYKSEKSPAAKSRSKSRGKSTDAKRKRDQDSNEDTPKKTEKSSVVKSRSKSRAQSTAGKHKRGHDSDEETPKKTEKSSVVKSRSKSTAGKHKRGQDSDEETPENTEKPAAAKPRRKSRAKSKGALKDSGNKQAGAEEESSKKKRKSQKQQQSAVSRDQLLTLPVPMDDIKDEPVSFIEEPAQNTDKENLTSQDSEEPNGRRSRRGGTAVSYKEPTLNAKLRRGDPTSNSVYEGKHAPKIDVYKSKKDIKKRISNPGLPKNRRVLGTISNVIDDDE